MKTKKTNENKNNNCRTTNKPTHYNQYVGVDHLRDFKDLFLNSTIVRLGLGYFSHTAPTNTCFQLDAFFDFVSNIIVSILRSISGPHKTILSLIFGIDRHN